MSGDIFKKAFSKSSEEDRQRKLESDSDTEIQRERIEELREDVESLFSQIPTVFEVPQSHVEFDLSVKFQVRTLDGDGFHLVVTIDWWEPESSVRLLVSDDTGSQGWYSAKVNQYSQDFRSLLESFTSHYVDRDAAIEWLASELGRILGEEYERHRDFYEKMEKGR